MSDYVNKIAPEHSRTSCDDDDLYNAAYGLDDFDGRGRCYRCTLLMAQAKARIEDAAAPAAPAADAGLVDALEMIVNPIEAMRRELQEGEQLNGMVAMQLASDPEYLRGVAKAALAAHRAKGVV